MERFPNTERPDYVVLLKMLLIAVALMGLYYFIFEY